MAAECPYALAPIQGHLCAKQRDFVANVRTGCLTWPKTAPRLAKMPFTREAVFRVLPRMRTLLPLEQQFKRGWSSYEGSRFKNSFRQTPYRSRPAMMIA
jgi:hypothetical protein